MDGRWRGRLRPGAAESDRSDEQRDHDSDQSVVDVQAVDVQRMRSVCRRHGIDPLSTSKRSMRHDTRHQGRR